MVGSFLKMVKNKRAYSIFISIFFVFISVFFLHQTQLENKFSSPQNTQNLAEREFVYWFALSDFGNLNWIDRELKQSKNFSFDSVDYSQSELRAYISDLSEQREIAFDTIGGVFPLARFMFKNIIFAPEQLNPYEIIDDPEVVAASNAVNNQIETIINNWKAVPHFDVLFTSNPSNVALENEALYLYNLSSKFYVHNYREKTVFLEKYGLTDKDLTANPLSGNVVKALKQHFTASHLIITSLLEQKSLSNNSFFVADGRVFDLKSEDYISIRNMGFAIDSTPQLKTTFQIAIIMFVLGFINLLILGVVRGFNKEVFVNLGFYSIIFMAMLIMPSLAGPILQGFIYFPAMETLAISGWWIAPVTVSLSVIAPSVILYGVVERIKPLTVLRNIEANDVALLAILQAAFVWFNFLYIIYTNDSANSFVVAIIASAPLLLFHFWKSRLIGLDPKPTSVFALESCFIFVLLLTASVDIILSGFTAVIFFHLLIFSTQIFFKHQVQHNNLDSKHLITQNILSPETLKIREKIKKNSQKNILILTSGDLEFGAHIFDKITQSLLENKVILEIDASDCSSDYSLVSKIVGRRVEDSSSGFDAAIGFAGDLIPFGSMISEKATTSGVKDSHIKECGYMHLKAYIENTQCEYFLIRNIQSADALSIEWMEKILLKPWAEGVKFYLLTADADLPSHFSKVEYIKHELDEMNRIEAVSYLHQFTSLSIILKEMIVDELSNKSGLFLAHDLKHLGEIANQKITNNSSLSDFAVFEEVKKTFFNSQDEKINQIIGSICENSEHKLFIAVAAYLGTEVELPLIAKILKTDIQTVFKLCDEINANHQIFLDPKSDGLSLVFRSSAFHKICSQFFRFHKIKNEQSSFAQYVTSEILRNSLDKKNISDELVSKSLIYLYDSDNVEPIWLLKNLLAYSKQMSFSQNVMLARSFLEMSKELLDKNQNKISGQQLRLLEQNIEVTHIFIQLQNNDENPVMLGEKIVRFFQRWEEKIDCEPDIIYLMLKRLYDLRFERPPFIDSLQLTCEQLIRSENEFPPWFRAELIHYKNLALLFVNHDVDDKVLKDSFFKQFRDALNILEIELDSPSELASFSRIATTIISQDPYGNDIDSLAEKAVEIKKRLFDEEGVAITKGALARASFFVGQDLLKDQKTEKAAEAFEKFLVAAEDWKDASLKLEGPLFVILMIENMKAQSYLNLGIISNDVVNYEHAYASLKSNLDKGIIPNIDNMSVLRQLSSTYSLLLELQLYNDKFCKDYMIADTQKFFDDFNASFDSYVVDKFLVLIKKYKLAWVMPSIN